MNITIIIICMICLVAAILIDNKFNIPIGLTAMLAAFVICNLGFGMSANAVITSYFPGTIVLPLILAMLFFSVFSKSGTSQILAKSLLNFIRGNMKLYPWTLYFLCIILYSLLDGGALRYIIAPLVFSVAKAGGGSVLMAIATAFLPFVAGSMNPYIGIDASTRLGILTDMGLENGSMINLAIWAITLILTTSVQLFVYMITRSWKVPNFDFKSNEEKHEFTQEQKKCFAVLAATVLLFVLPPLLKTVLPCEFTMKLASLLNTYVVFICGALVIIVLGLGDWREMLSHVSLRPIMMLIGITFLIKTAQEAGLQELCTQAASAAPAWLIPPVLLLIAAVLSFFVAAPTINPMLFPMVAAMAKTPAQAILYISCVAVGAASSSISPLSSTGVAFLSTVDLKEHDIYSKYMFIMAFLSPVVMAALAAAGVFHVIGTFFAGWYF